MSLPLHAPPCSNRRSIQCRAILLLLPCFSLLYFLSLCFSCCSSQTVQGPCFFTAHPHPLPSIFLPVCQRGWGGGERQGLVVNHQCTHTQTGPAKWGEAAGEEISGKERQVCRVQPRMTKSGKRMCVCGLGVFSKCQKIFIKIIQLSIYVNVHVCVCVWGASCSSSSVGGLACLLLRCYNLPGSGGTIISSMSFLLLLLLLSLCTSFITIAPWI